MAGLKEKLARWFLPAFMLASSIALLVVGVPRFLHELALVPGTPILHRLNAGEALTEEEWRTLEQSRLDALNFIELSDAYTDLGASYLMRAQRAQTREDQMSFAKMAIEVSIEGLNLSPMNTYAWLRLCSAKLILGPEHYDEALENWRRSIETARFEPFLLFTRVHLGTILFQNMSDEDINLFKEQLGMAYLHDRWSLREYFRKNNLIAWIDILCEPESEMKAYLIS